MPQPEALGFVHTFIAAAQPVPQVTLLLLHGTGGNEDDLVPLGRELWPGAALLGVRGQVSERGMPRFFRRFAEGVFDVEDLKFRTEELARFIPAAAAQYTFSPQRVIAVGYSNGANIAASLILLHPHVLAGAVLFRAVTPFRPDIIPDLHHLPIFVGSGDRDPIVPRDKAEMLAALLERGRADVTRAWHRGGHELGTDDIDAANAWLSGNKIRNRLAA